jgi:hypothetical protein
MPGRPGMCIRLRLAGNGRYLSLIKNLSKSRDPGTWSRDGDTDPSSARFPKHCGQVHSLTKWRYPVSTLGLSGEWREVNRLL